MTIAILVITNIITLYIACHYRSMADMYKEYYNRLINETDRLNKSK